MSEDTLPTITIYATDPEYDMIPLYIFDLDGTLALTEHRQHLVDHDSPNWPVISTMVTLLDKGVDIWIWSGRSAEVMNETRTWLQGCINADRADEIELCMRREGDFTPDEELKQAWLQGMSAFDRKRLVAVFDDRAKVVAMWRRNGVPCFQVAPGDF